MTEHMSLKCRLERRLPVNAILSHGNDFAIAQSKVQYTRTKYARIAGGCLIILAVK